MSQVMINLQENSQEMSAVIHSNKGAHPNSILVLTTSYPNSSDDWSGVFIHKLNVALTGLGYRIHVLAPSNGEFYGVKEFDGVTVKRFSYFWPRQMERLCSGAGGIPENLDKSLLAKLQLVTMTAVFLFQALMWQRNAGIIYANWLGSGVVGAIAGFFRGTPLVTSFRGDDGYLARERFIWRIFSRFVIDRSAALAPVSGALGEICIELGASSQKVFRPRFGVDTEMFSPELETGSLNRPVKIVCVASLVPKKGIQDLITAFSSSLFEGAQLEIVGEGFYQDHLKTLAREYGIAERVIWRGLATPAEVAKIMKSSDILCLPSYTEGSPNVVKEAMSCGLPVVASAVGGVPELVAHEETGFLYEAGNVEDLSEKLMLLVRSPSMRQSLGAKGRKKILESGMDWNDTANEFHMIFQSVMKVRP